MNFLTAKKRKAGNISSFYSIFMLQTVDKVQLRN